MVVLDLHDGDSTNSGLDKESIRLSIVNDFWAIANRVSKPRSGYVFVSILPEEVLLDLRFITETDAFPTSASPLFDEGRDSLHDFDICDIFNPLQAGHELLF